MAVCNIFSEIQPDKGTFMTFSQYMEDLTRNRVEGSAYRIVPSRFDILKVDYKGDWKTDFPKALQNEYENSCAYARSKIQWTPQVASNLFNQFLVNHIYSISGEKIDNIYDTEEISLQTYNTYNGMGYSDILCTIPSNSSAYEYSAVINDGDEHLVNQNTYIEGYKTGETPLDGTLSGNETYYYKYGVEITRTKSDATSYQFNTIIVYYDIYNGDNSIYSNIPMGMYITPNAELITKYISSSDIYNGGTSYGLRIASRYAVSPSGIKIDGPIEICDDYSSYCQLMSAMADTQNKMMEIVNASYSQMESIKISLSAIKNNRTNVPYMKNVGGKLYWFVNGRIISEYAAAVYPDLSDIPDQMLGDINDYLNQQISKQ